MGISVCKNCPNQGCGAYHDICPEYQEQKAQLEEEHKREQLNRSFSDYYASIRYSKLKQKYYRGKKRR